MNEEKKLITAIVIVAIVILLVSGGTLAYWQWTTSELEATLVNGSPTGDLSDTKMYIDFPSNDLHNLYPTSDCEANGTSSWLTEVTIDNKTGVVISPIFKLKVKIEDKNGNIITNSTSPGNSNPNRYYIKYAITSENGLCSAPLYSGRFNQNTQTNATTLPGWYDSENITLIDQTTNFPIVSGNMNSGVSFYANPMKETTQKYKVWVWLDKEYTSLNVGTEVTDPMQDAKVTVSWSENSQLTQVKKAKTGEAIAIYSADDSSLRFYRVANPSSVTVGSQYNGRTVTNVYTGFENSNDFSCPFGSVETIVFEDYIYPTSTANWFCEMTDIKYADLLKLDTSNVTNMRYMFASSYGDVNLDLSHFNTSNVIDMGEMFSWSEINVVGLENWDTSNVTKMESMLLSEAGLNLDLSGWNVCKVTSYSDFAGDNVVQPHFGNPARCNGNTKVGKDNAVGDAYAVYFESDHSLRFYRSTTAITAGSTFDGRTVSAVYTGFENQDYENAFVDMDGGGWGPQWIRYNINTIVFEDYIYPLYTSNWFYNLKNIVSMDLSKLDTSSTIRMKKMFYESSGTIIGLENWDTSNVINMSKMFNNFNGTITGLEKWNTSKVSNMYYMFSGATITSTLDLSNWNVCNVVAYDSFNDASGLINRPNFSDKSTCPVVNIETAEFYIVEYGMADGTYEFVVGMTWNDFIGSGYNYSEYFKDLGDEEVWLSGITISADESLNTSVKLTDLIIPGNTYYPIP